MHNKGIYSVVSTFILIALIIFSMLFIVYLGSSSIVTVEIASAQIGPLQQSNQIKAEILSCWKGLFESKIDSADNNYCSSKSVKGYSLEKLDFLSCQPKKWVFGDMNNCKRKFTYLEKIQDLNAQNCLGRLTLCFGDK